MLRLDILMLLAFFIGAGAQSPPPPAQLLDVISVKPVPLKAEPRGRAMGAGPGGRFTALSVPLGMLLNTAYEFPPERMVGAPK
jgi:hypothetical protein